MKFNLNSYASHFLNCVWVFIRHLTRSLVGCILAEWVYLTIEFIHKMFIWQLSLSNILNILGSYFLCCICAILPIIINCIFLTSRIIKTRTNCLSWILSMSTHEHIHSFCLLWDNWEKILVQIKSATKTKKYTKCMYSLNGVLKQAKQCVCCKLNHKNQLVWHRDWGALQKSLSWIKHTAISAWGYEEHELMWVI